MANRITDFISRAFKSQSTQNITMNPPQNQIVAGMDLSSIIPAMYQAWGAYGYQPSQTWYQLATMYNSWVYTAIEKKARTLATLPPKLYRYENISSGKTVRPQGIKAMIQTKGLYMTPSKEAIHAELKQMGVKRIELEDHPFLDLVNKPNPDMVRFNFWHLMAIHLELNGAVGIYKAKYFLGTPSELHILPQTWTGQFKPIPTPYGIGGYKLIDQDIMQEFTKEEIIWPHYSSLKNPFEGMSALKAQLYSYNLDQYLQQQMIALFKNNTMFSSVFKTKNNEPLSAAAYNQVMSSLKNYQGPKAAFQPFLLNGLEMEKTLNTTAKDSMVAEIEKFSRDKMLSAHDVSAGKVGLVDSQNRANLDAVNQNYFNEAIKPLAMLITEYFDRYLVPEFDDRLDFEFDTPHFVDRDIDIKEREANLRSGVTTINEERQKIGLENDASLENVRFVPRGMLAIRDGKIVPELSPAPATPSWMQQPGQEPKKPEEPGEPKPGEGKALAGKETKFWTPERKALAYKKFVKNVTPYEKDFQAAMAEHFAWVEKECIKLLEKSGVKIKANTGAMSKAHRAEWLKENKAKIEELLPSKADLKKDLKERTKPIYQDTLKGGGQNRIDEFSGKVDGKKLFTKADDDFEDIKFNINDPRVKKWLGDRLEEFSNSASDTTIDAVKSTLKADFEEGEPLAKMSEHLRDIFEGGETYRANLIARTETTSAYNKGDIESISQMGLGERVGKIWLAEPDDATRETHAEAGDTYDDGTDEDGSIMTIDKEFKVGTDSMQSPGNGSDAAENCNCFIPETELFSPDMKKLLKSRFKGNVITFKTANGHKFTCTPNHPILTSHGWVKAQFIKEGNCIISTSRDDWMGLRNLDVKNRPTSFEKVYTSLAKVKNPVGIIGTTINFYGDRPEGNVDIVSMNGKLFDRIETCRDKIVKNILLAEANLRERGLLDNRLFNTGFDKKISRLVSDNGIRLFGKKFPSIHVGLRHPLEHCFASIPWANPDSLEAMVNCTSGNSDGMGDCFDRHSGIEHFCNLDRINNDSGMMVVPENNTATLIKPSVNRLYCNPVTLRNIGNALSVSVFLDEILDIHIDSYSGDVYTAETHKGIYISNGVIAKNCRCSLVYEVFDESGQEEI